VGAFNNKVPSGKRRDVQVVELLPKGAGCCSPYTISQPARDGGRLSDATDHGKNRLSRRRPRRRLNPDGERHVAAPFRTTFDHRKHAGSRWLDQRVDGAESQARWIKGAAPALSDLSGGHADLSFAPLSGPTLELIQGGKIKAIALASDKRSPFLPDVPTINESVKLKNFEHSIWSGIFASADTPEPIITRLNAAMQEWTVSPENQDRLAKNGARPMVALDTPQSAAFFKAQQEKVEKIVRSIKLDPQ